MHDIWEPALNNKIHQFIDRKAKEYPELHLTDKWNSYEYSGRPNKYNRPSKRQHQKNL